MNNWKMKQLHQKGQQQQCGIFLTAFFAITPSWHCNTCYSTSEIHWQVLSTKSIQHQQAIQSIHMATNKWRTRASNRLSIQLLHNKAHFEYVQCCQHSIWLCCTCNWLFACHVDKHCLTKTWHRQAGCLLYDHGPFDQSFHSFNRKGYGPTHFLLTVPNGRKMALLCAAKGQTTYAKTGSMMKIQNYNEQWTRADFFYYRHWADSLSFFCGQNFVV